MGKITKFRIFIRIILFLLILFLSAVYFILHSPSHYKSIKKKMLSEYSPQESKYEKLKISNTDIKVILDTIRKKPKISFQVSTSFTASKRPAKLTVKLFRSENKDGEYVLVQERNLLKMINMSRKRRRRINFSRFNTGSSSSSSYHRRASGIDKQNVKFSRTVNFLISDLEPLKAKRNYMYYRCEFHTDNGEKIMLPVIKTPIIPAPVFNKNTWTWKPLSPKPPFVNGYLAVRLYTILSDRYIVFDLKPLTSLIRQKYLSVPTSITFILNKKKFLADKNTRVYMSIGRCMKPLQRSWHKKFFNRNHQQQLLLPSFSGLNFWTKGVKYKIKRAWVNGRRCNPYLLEKESYYYIGKIRLKLLIGPQGAGEKSKKLYDMNIFAPLHLNEMLQFYSTSHGIVIDWGNFVNNYKKENWFFEPIIEIKRDRKVIASLGLTKGSFTDAAAELKYGKKYLYTVSMENAWIKTQAWINGKVFNVYVKSPSISFNSFVLSLCNKSDNTPSLYIPDDEPRHIRVGITINNMMYNDTGVPSMIILQKLVRMLNSHGCIAIYDRINTAKLVEEYKRVIPKNNIDVNIKPKAVDFMLRFFDYSREKGNGIEIWLTKMRNKKDVNITSSWRIARIPLENIKSLNVEKDIFSPLIKFIKQLNKFPKIQIRKQQHFSRQKNPIEPIKNIIFWTLKPVWQRKQIKQYQAISDSIMLELSNNLKDIKILSNNSWLLLLKERSLHAEQGIKMFEDVHGNALLTGYIYMRNKNPHYLFLLTDVKSDILLGSLSASGIDYKNIASKIARWIKSIKLPHINDRKLLYADMMLQNEKKLKYFCPCRYRDRKVDKEETINKQKYLKGEHRNITDYAKRLFNRGNHYLAINILKDEWNKKHERKVGHLLLTIFDRLHLYNSAWKLAKEIIRRFGKNEIKPEFLIKIKAMARTHKNVHSTHLPINSIISTDEDIIDAKMKQKNREKYYRRVVSRYDELNDFFAARDAIGEEWNSKGILMSDKITFSTDNPSEIKELSLRENGVMNVTVYLTSHKNGKIKCLWKGYFRTFYQFPRLSKQNVSEDNILNTVLYNRDLKTFVELKNYLNKRWYWTKNGFKPIKQFYTESLQTLKNIEKLRYTGEYFLYRLFAVDILAKSGDNEAKNIIRSLLNRPIPVSVGDRPLKSTQFLLFRAYKGSRQAIHILLTKHVDLYAFLKEAVYIFTVTNNKKALLNMLRKKSLKADDLLLYLYFCDTTLLKKILYKYYRLIWKRMRRSELLYWFVNGYDEPKLSERYYFSDDFYSKRMAVFLEGKPYDEIIRGR